MTIDCRYTHLLSQHENSLPTWSKNCGRTHVAHRRTDWQYTAPTTWQSQKLLVPQPTLPAFFRLRLYSIQLRDQLKLHSGCFDRLWRTIFQICFESLHRLIGYHLPNTQRNELERTAICPRQLYINSLTHHLLFSLTIFCLPKIGLKPTASWQQLATDIQDLKESMRNR